MGVRFAFATNGNAVRSFDLVAGTTADVEFMHFPTPQELLDLLKLTDDESPLEKVCREVPFLPTARYYQERAVEGVIRALGRGQKNALITLATGTGKTFIAYQLVKKLVAANSAAPRASRFRPRPRPRLPNSDCNRVSNVMKGTLR